MKAKRVLPNDVLEEVKDTADWTDDDGEVRELIAEDFKRMKPFSSLPPDLQHTLREIQRGNVTFRPEPDSDSKEERVPVKLSRSVVERFQASGTEWESKVDAALRQWLDEHQEADLAQIPPPAQAGPVVQPPPPQRPARRCHRLAPGCTPRYGRVPSC